MNMIKFRMGRGVIWGSVKNVKIIRFFFYIFLDILYKMKENLGQEHVKRGLYSSREKLEQFSLLSLEK